MNRENIQKVRDHIAGLPKPLFTMEYYSKDTACGTAACIAGWATLLLAPEEQPGPGPARIALNLSRDEAAALFNCGDPDDGSPEYARWKATPAQAVRVLDHLLETGEVDWSIIDTVTA